MMSCKKAAELISLSLETPLTLGQRISLGFHVGICGMCRRFRRQSRLIQEIGQRIGKEFPAENLSNEARERIRRAIVDATEP